MYTLLVMAKGVEVYRRVFQKQTRAFDWFWWRVGQMQRKTARTPGDVVMLCDRNGVVIAMVGDRDNVRAG
jgi:hypothetical protein